MARRRRKRNPLLIRILVASVAAHAVALPVAAHFGAFKAIRKQFGTSRVVMVSMPPLEAEKPKAAEKKPPKAKTAAAKKAGSAAPKATAAQKAGVPQPKVVAANATGDGSDGPGGGATVDADASGKAGALPGGPPVAPPPPPEVDPPPAKPPETKPEPPPVAPKPPEPPPVEPKKADPVVEAPKPRRIVQAEAVEAPQPTIPDELRTEPFEKTLVVEADVDAGGHPTNVRVAETTGVKALDAIGLDTARRYRFKPATVDDAPVEQHVRFRIVFKVE